MVFSFVGAPAILCTHCIDYTKSQKEKSLNTCILRIGVCGLQSPTFFLGTSTKFYVFNVQLFTFTACLKGTENLRKFTI